MRVLLSVCIGLLSLVCTVPAIAREVLVCNLVNAPMSKTKPFEMAPGTIFLCKDKNFNNIPTSLAGLYSEGYRLVSAIAFDTEFEGKKTTVLQYYLEK